MKPQITLFAIFLSLTAFMSSCNKDNTEEPIAWEVLNFPTEMTSISSSGSSSIYEFEYNNNQQTKIIKDGNYYTVIADYDQDGYPTPIRWENKSSGVTTRHLFHTNILDELS